MRVLISNDDGPPGSESPFLQEFVESLSATGWEIHVVIPHTQRSWIGKGVTISDSVTTSYYHPSVGSINDVHAEGAWTLLSCTPASCVNIALGNLFPPQYFDLVISGPNFGRNATTGSALASGTIGAAMEAALMHTKSIALSYAYFQRSDCADPKKATNATKMAVKVIHELVPLFKDIHAPDLYNVNIPLIEGPYDEIVVTDFHRGGYEQLYQMDPNGQFKFAPKYVSYEDAHPKSDFWAIAQHKVSVTPLVASFHVEQDHLNHLNSVLHNKRLATL
ncbi:survival protein sure-like phosphatase/nucleotidase [Gorgonomyces haynaldii]|nr:survival protein sure-like phosphatase/nucleotidase [Gorgonomyces haynaldii]